MLSVYRGWRASLKSSDWRVALGTPDLDEPIVTTTHSHERAVDEGLRTQVPRIVGDQHPRV